MIRSQKLFASLGILFFVFISVFGVNAAISHDNENGQMTGCPLSGGMAAICPMNAVEHLSAWLQSFLTAPTKSYTAILLALLLIYWLFASNLKSVKEKRRVVLDTRHYSKLFNHLNAEFFKGILHSRIYA